MAFIRSSTVRDLRRKLYHKILRLPLSFFTDARKGDVMTRISNDVQEVEISVMSSLTMMFRDPILILVFVIYLFVSSYELTLFALALLPVSGWLIGRASRTLRSSSLVGPAKPRTTAFCCGRNTYRSENCKRIQCRGKNESSVCRFK